MRKMKKIPFNVEFYPEIAEGTYKVVTRDGRDVELLKVNADLTDNESIVALINGKEGKKKYVKTYFSSGRAINENDDDLFIITNEPEPSEFENCISELIDEIDGDYAAFINPTVYDKYIRKYAPKLLSIARKEFTDELPKWKRLPFSGVSYADDSIGVMCLQNGNGPTTSGQTVVYKGNYYIPAFDLDKLPKEE